LLLDLISLCLPSTEQIADGASRVARRLRRSFNRVRYTVHTWTGTLQSEPDELVGSDSFTSGLCLAVDPNTFILSASEPEALIGTQRNTRLVWASRSSDDADLDLAIFEEIEREGKP
jgi:hypothetical protein